MSDAPEREREAENVSDDDDEAVLVVESPEPEGSPRPREEESSDVVLSAEPSSEEEFDEEEVMDEEDIEDYFEAGSPDHSEVIGSEMSDMAGSSSSPQKVDMDGKTMHKDKREFRSELERDESEPEEEEEEENEEELMSKAADVEMPMEKAKSPDPEKEDKPVEETGMDSEAQAPPAREPPVPLDPQEILLVRALTVDDLPDLAIPQEPTMENLTEIAHRRGQTLNTFIRERDEARAIAHQYKTQLKRREGEIQRITAENSTLTTQLREAIQAKCNIMAQMHLVKVKEIKINHQKKTSKQELKVMEAHAKKLSDQLQQQRIELQDVRLAAESRAMALERQITLKTQELQAKEEESNNLSERLTEEQRRSETLMEKLREARNSEIATQETHQQHIQAQTQLANIYKTDSENADILVEKLRCVIEELQDAVKLTTDKYGELETTAVHEKAEFLAKLAQRDKTIETLSQELKSANILLEQKKQEDETVSEHAANLGPTAAVARKLVKSGLTLTQVYTQLATANEDLDIRKAECQQLREVVDSMLKEVAERAPRAALEQEALKRAQQENERLLMEHDTAIKQCDTIKAEAHEERRRAAKLERDNKRQETLINDLSKQVMVLVQEVDALKHRRLPPSINDSYGSLVALSASEVVSERLVPFRDVDELQRRNLELLAVVRDLSAKADAEEKAAASGKDVLALTEKLEEAMRQLTELQEREKQHEELLERLMQQRDHYRELAATPRHPRSTHEVALSPMKMDPLSPMKRMPVPSSEDQELKNELQAAENELENTRKQVEGLKKDMANREGELAKQLEELRQEVLGQKLNNTKLIALCEHKSEKLLRAEKKADEVTKKLEAETKTNQGRAEELSKCHKILCELQNQSITIRSELEHSKITIMSLKTELKKSQLSEKALKEKCANLQRSATEHASISSSIEIMKAAFERSNSESTAILVRQLDEARLEARALAQRLKEETSRLGAELAELQTALQGERSKVVDAESRTEQAEKHKVEAEGRLLQAERDVIALRAHRNPVVETASQTDLCVSEEVLREKRSAQRSSELELQVAEIRGQLERSEARAAELSTIVECTQKALEEAHRHQDQINEDAQQRIKETCDEVAKLQQKEKEHEVLIRDLQGEVSRTESSRMQEVAELTEKLKDTTEALQQSKSVEETNLALQIELLNAEERAEKVSKTLAEEMQRHAEAQKEADALREQLAMQKEASKAIMNDLEANRRKVTEVETRLAAREEEMQGAASEREVEIGELRKQTSALLDQVQLMGAEISALKQQLQQQPSTSSAADQLNVSGVLSSEDSASTEQLLQVLRYLRSEKNAALANANALSRQNSDLKAQIGALEHQLKETVAQITQLEAGTPGGDAALRSRSNELLRRLDTLSALSESSSRQRELANTLRTENEQVKARLKVLEEGANATQDNLKKANEMVETLKMELTASRAETTRWRQCANQLTERANRANPEELKRLLQERENLQRQLAGEREELRRARQTLTEREAEVNRVREEDARALKAKDELLNAQKEKEIVIRRIAKKYKTQWEELQSSQAQARQEAEAQQQAQVQEQAKVQETESRLQEAEAATQQAEARVQELETTVQDLNSRVQEYESKAQALQAGTQQSSAKQQELYSKLEEYTKEVESMRREKIAAAEKSERAKVVLNQARQKISQTNSENMALRTEVADLQNTVAQLTERLQGSEQGREEEAARKAALTTQYEGRIARLERELAELPPSQARSTMRQDKQAPKSTVTPGEKSSNEPPTANIRPMAGPSQSKPQQGQQAAAVPPTSRTAPTARLRPMAVPLRAVAILAPSAAPSSSATVAPVQGVQVASSGSEASTSRVGGTESGEEDQQGQGQSQGGQGQGVQGQGATIVLVRPQEVQPAVSSSQLTQPQSQSQQGQQGQPPPTLKRTRTDQDQSVAEPRAKHPRSEVSSASNVEAHEEPSSSLHVVQDVIVVDSEDDTEEEPEQDQDEDMEDEEDEDEGDQEEAYTEDEEEEEEEEEDEGSPGTDPENPEMEGAHDQGSDHEGTQNAPEEENEVFVLEEPPQLPPDLQGLVDTETREPTSSSAPPRQGTQDEPQAEQGQAMTGGSSSTASVMKKTAPSDFPPSAELSESGSSEAQEKSIPRPSIEHAVGSPGAVGQDIPSSSSGGPSSAGHSSESSQLSASQQIMVLELEQGEMQAGPEASSPDARRGISPRGANRARRSSTRTRASGRPIPIVWDQGDQNIAPSGGVSRGMGDMSRGMRGMGPGYRRPRGRGNYPSNMRF